MTVDVSTGEKQSNPDSVKEVVVVRRGASSVTGERREGVVCGSHRQPKKQGCNPLESILVGQE